MSEKEYVFIGTARNKTRDYIKFLEKENRELKGEIEYWQKACDKKQDKIFELLKKLEGDK